MKLAFLGGGNMAGALIGGLIARGVDAGAIHVLEVNPETRERLAARYGVHAAAAPDAALRACDTLVLAVKPQDMRAALGALGVDVGDMLVISIAAGLRLQDLSRLKNRRRSF